MGIDKPVNKVYTYGMKRRINRQKLSEFRAKHPQMSYAAIARTFHVTRQAIQRILAQKADVFDVTLTDIGMTISKFADSPEKAIKEARLRLDSFGLPAFLEEGK